MSTVLELTDQNNVLTLLKQGDRQGFELLYSTYSKTLYGIINKTCADKRLAESILQGVLITAWQNRHDYNPVKQHFFGWLLAITRQVSVGVLKQIPPAKAEIQTVANNVVNKESVLTLVYFRGYTLAVAAELHGFTLQQAKLMLKTELDKLRTGYIKQ